MTGDFFTKPLQGAQFIKFRKEILNLEYDDLSMYSTDRSQECVGLNKALTDEDLNGLNKAPTDEGIKASSNVDDP